jgi:lysophospholipase L1-like esterase
MQANPDVVLLKAGTNDVVKGAASMVTDMTALLAALSSSLPRARILVTSILLLPQAPGMANYSSTIRQYNAALPGLVAAVPGASFVDIAGATGMCFDPSDPRYTLCAVCNGPCGGYDPSACPPRGYSYCHPSGAGYALMGGVWASALLPILHEVLQSKVTVAATATVA